MFKTYSVPAQLTIQGIGRYGFAASCFVGGAYLIATGIVVVAKR